MVAALFHPSRAKLAKIQRGFRLSVSITTFAFLGGIEEKNHNPPNTQPIITITDSSRLTISILLKSDIFSGQVGQFCSYFGKVLDKVMVMSS